MILSIRRQVLNDQTQSSYFKVCSLSSYFKVWVPYSISRILFSSFFHYNVFQYLLEFPKFSEDPASAINHLWKLNTDEKLSAFEQSRNRVVKIKRVNGLPRLLQQIFVRLSKIARNTYEKDMKETKCCTICLNSILPASFSSARPFARLVDNRRTIPPWWIMTRWNLRKVIYLTSYLYILRYN